MFLKKEYIGLSVTLSALAFNPGNKTGIENMDCRTKGFLCGQI